MSEFSTKLNIIVSIVALFAILIFIRYIIILIEFQSYSFPKSKQCNNINDLFPDSRQFILKDNTMKSLDKTVNKVNKTSGIVNYIAKNKCPSYNKDIYLKVNGNFIYSTSDEFLKFNYTINDCHNKPIFVINQDAKNFQHENFKKEHNLIAEVMSLEKDFLAFIVSDKFLELSFDIYDINKQIVAKIEKNNTNSSWNVEIFIKHHITADLSLIIVLISKFAKFEIDTCSLFFGGITTLLIFTTLVGPLVILFLLYVMYCEKKLYKDKRGGNKKSLKERKEELLDSPVQGNAFSNINS